MITVRVVRKGTPIDINENRFDTYAGFGFKVVNEQMFESISFKEMVLYVGEDHLSHFDGLESPEIISAIEVYFNRPPSPDASNSGRFTSMIEVVTVDEYERLVELFQVTPMSSEGE